MGKQKRLRREVKREESKLAQELGGRRTFNSGAGDEKGDAAVPHTYEVRDGGVFETSPVALRIESKITGKSGFTLYATEWEKLRRAALRQDETPVFIIRLFTRCATHLRLVVMPTEHAEYITGAPVRCDASRSFSPRSYRISEQLWNTAVLEHLEHERAEKDQPGEFRVPHLRFKLGNKPYDLTILTWPWYVALYEHRHGVGLEGA